MLKYDADNAGFFNCKMSLAQYFFIVVSTYLPGSEIV